MGSVLSSCEESKLKFAGTYTTFEVPQEKNEPGRFELNIPNGTLLSRYDVDVSGGIQETEILGETEYR